MSSHTAAENHFQSSDGMSIFYRCQSAQDETARLVLAHGLGEHSGRYAHVMDRLTGRGISVWALDHRGHGRSDGKPGHIDTIDQYLNDLEKMVHIAKTGMPDGMKCFLLGHSMGGLIVLRLAQTRPDLTNGVIASSPGLNPGIKVPLVKGTAAKILSRITPALSFDNELDSSFLSHDPKVVTAYNTDPLVHRKITARWFTEFLSAMAAARGDAGRIRMPVLMQVAGDDRLVHAQTSRQFYDALTTSDKTLCFYDGLYHEIYNEAEPDRENVLNDLENWLSTHI